MQSRVHPHGCLTGRACHAGAVQSCSGLVTHWLSLDLRGRVRYGRGYAMQETVLLEAQLQPPGTC